VHPLAPVEVHPLLGVGGQARSEARRAERSGWPATRSVGQGRFGAFPWLGSGDRRAVRRSEALGGAIEGDRSGRFCRLGGRAGAEVVVFEAVAVALEAHRGNATLNYRSVLVREPGPDEAELYRRPDHRLRRRRVSSAERTV
jgi:hypothetical protein